MTGEEISADLEMVKAAMMEELGIGRKDALPLEDRGHRDIGNIPRIHVPRAQGSDNPWQNVVFDDVDEAELQLDNIADGQLYRDRRAREAAFLGRGEPGRGGRGGRGALSTQKPGRGGHAARGNGRGGRGDYMPSPFSQSSTKSNSSSSSIPKGPKLRGRGNQMYDSRRLVERNAMVDAAIARLRGPSSQAQVPRGPRVPAKSVFGANLVSTEEFYNHAGIRPTSTSIANTVVEHASEFSETDQPRAAIVRKHLPGEEAHTTSKHSVGVNRPLTNTATNTAANTATNTAKANSVENKTQLTSVPLSDKKKPTSNPIKDKKKQTSTLIKDNKEPVVPTLIGDKKQTIPAAINHGQAGLAGSRWADTQATVIPVVRFLDPPVAPASALPVIKPYIAPVTKASDIVVAEAAGPSIGNIAPTQVQAEVDITPTPTSVDTFPINSVVPRVLRKIEGVKISNSSMSEKPGAIRFITNAGSDCAHLQILINNLTVLEEPLYSTDTFEHQNDSIIFQSHSEQMDGLKWMLRCPLPYQPCMVVTMMKGWVRNTPRPIQIQPLAVPSNAIPVAGKPTSERSVNQESSSELVTLLDSDTDTPKGVELLIDFDAEEETSPLSPNIHVLMGLMTDDRSIDDFLERLDASLDEGFLAQVFSVAGYPPTEGYSPQMISAATKLVVELYIQSEIFHKLPPDVSEPIAYETSVKVLEKALSIWRSQHVEPLQTSQPDNDPSAKPNYRPGVYPSDELISLRSRASTIEGRLIPEYDDLSTKQKAKTWTNTSISDGYRSGFLGIMSALSPVDAPSTGTPTGAKKSPGVSVSHMIASSTVISTGITTVESGGTQDKDKLTVPSSPVPIIYGKPACAPCGPERREPFISDRVSNVGQAETRLPPEVDMKSESSDSELSSKLRALSLVHMPAVSNSNKDTKSIFCKGDVGSSTTTAKENVHPTNLPKGENATRSTFQARPRSPQPTPILEINNSDLKGNPGLAASRWAQPTNEPPAVSGLRRSTSSRASHSPQKLNTSLEHTSLLGSRTSNQSLVTHIHRHDIAAHHPPPYPFAPTVFMSQQPFTPPQPAMPQLTTVLVTDPVTGEVREITGITKSTQPAMVFSAPYPMHQNPPAVHLSAGFQASPSVQISHFEGKACEPSSLRAGAQNFSPGAETRPPLSPTRRQNTQVQAKKYSDASPFY